MLIDLINSLIAAKTEKEREQIYKWLERVGVDRRTADVLVKHSDEWRLQDDEEN